MQQAPSATASPTICRRSARAAPPKKSSPLVDAFNDLLKRLNDKISSQKRFIADAAHQMKTPLAGLRTQSELALRETDPDQLRRSLEQIALSSQRTAHLISQLLSLTRMENLRDATPRWTSSTSHRCARAVVGDWVPPALERGIDLGYESDDIPAPIAGQAILLRELLNNLIDNALRYTPRGGSVTVRLASGPTGIAIDVEDSGVGIPESERALVFERFYRVLGTHVDGSGLGLAIVREIAEQHGAHVLILDGGTPDTPAGTLVRVTFPSLEASGT
jgi:two-component system sensor histidine kinase TctE